MRSSTVAQQGDHGDERSSSPAASMEDTAPKSAPSHGRNSRSRAFDQELGARVRAARIRLGMNQTALGAAIQVSFQQIQKYESGRDRISAATLLRIADVLKAPVAAFFDDGPLPSGDVAEMRESMRMAAAILRIRNPLIRKRISLLIDEVADVHSPAAADD